MSLRVGRALVALPSVRRSVKHSDTGLAGSIRILACRSGTLLSALNAASTPPRPTVPVMSGLQFQLAVCDRMQRIAILERRVGEHEAQIDFLVDCDRRLDLVGRRADADDDHARGQRCAVDDVLQDARHADALEDHRALRRQAERFGQPPRVPPRDRGQLAQLLARVEQQRQTRVEFTDEAVALPACKRRGGGRIDSRCIGSRASMSR